MFWVICKRFGAAAIVLILALFAGVVTLRTAAAPVPTLHAPGRQASLYVHPSSDGTGVTVAAGRVGGLVTPVHSTLYVGGTSYEPGHTSYEPGHAPGEGHWIFTFEGVAEGRTSPEMTAVVTTTEPDSGSVILGTSTFERRYVAGDAAVELTTLDNMARLQIPAGGLPRDSYVVMMDTFTPPADPPPGHLMLSRAYAIRASGALTEGLQPLLLFMDYEAAALGGTDPRTVSVFEWDANTNLWRELGSTPFGSETTHVQRITRFGTYALMAGTTWRDPFRDYSGVAARQHVRLVSGGRIALAPGENEGWIVSVPITPAGEFGQWHKLHYAGDTPTGTSLTVDVLAEDNALLLSNLADGASLASIDPALHPSLRLRATLRRTQPDAILYLDEWAVSWQAVPPPASKPRIFLPLIVSLSSAQAALPVAAAVAHPLAPGASPPWERAGLAGQSIDALSIAADDAKVVYAATGTTFGWGIFKTTDSGARWTQVYQRWPCYSVATDPQNPQTVYAGEMSNIWKTVNGGQTWSQVADLGVDEPKVLRVDPQDTRRVYAGATNYTGTGSGGVYRSVNGGATWQHPLVRQNVHDLAIAPADPATLYAAASNFSENPGGIFQSLDGGITWSRVFTHSRVNAVVVDPFDARGIYGGTEGDGMVKSTDGGRSWQSANTGLAHLIVRALAADPVHRGVLFAGTWEGGVYRSNDGGRSWESFNVGLESTFIASLALDAQGRTLYAGTQNSGVYRRAVLPPPPPAGSTYVTVTGADQRPVEGALVFKNGMLLTDALGAPAVTDAVGNLIVPDARPGDHLAAMQLLHEEPTIRRQHDGWAYRVYQTSLRVGEDSSVRGDLITAAGQHTLTVSSPLVLFNLVISVQWNATPEYLAEMTRAARLASDYLYDVTDGTMAFGQVAIYDNALHWNDADVQVLARNTVRPYAYIGGLVSHDAADVIRIGRGWDRGFGCGSWDQPDGYRTLIHEFGHYALHLYDSYFKYERDPATGYLIGVTDAGIGCTRFWEDYKDEEEATSASIMNWQYATTELADRRVSELWDGPQCVDTAQWQITGQSDWETLEAHYRDPANPPKWRVVRPGDSKVLAGPEALPTVWLPYPEIRTFADDRPAPLRQLVVYGPDNRPCTSGALVSLDTLRRGARVTIDQGITAVSPEARVGTIEIYGASVGDTVRAVSLDGALSGQIVVGAQDSLVLHLRRSSTALAVSAALNPYVSLIPGDDVHDLTLVVMGVGANAGLSALVVPPGSGLGQTVELRPRPGGEGYAGTVTLPVINTGLGSLYVRGVGGLGQQVMVDSDFNVASVDVIAEQDVYSPDGKAWWHLDERSFAAENTQIVLMPTGAVPLPQLAGTRPIGNAYSIRASGAVTHTLRDGILRLHYNPTALDPAVAPSELKVARWNGTTWDLLSGEVDPQQNTVAVLTNRLGIYVLLAPGEAADQRVYLPVMLR